MNSYSISLLVNRDPIIHVVACYSSCITVSGQHKTIPNSGYFFAGVPDPQAVPKRINCISIVAEFDQDTSFEKKKKKNYKREDCQM